MNDAAVSSQLSRLLDAALDLPPAERDAWIDTLDHTHDGLKPRLRALLARAAEVESRNFMGSLPPVGESDGDEDAAQTQPVEAAGGRVGPYQLQRQLGAGGMGTVWLATRADGLFERSIALKLPHRGMFGADLAERMARERGILAGLDHPNIARLYDAGLTIDGQPYLALEYVEGVAVDEYCRSRQCDLRERLRLFLQVADAVASAHARLVVHRDLKPANILVTHDGNVRLLDFGIAKLLDAPVAGETPLTQLSVHAMTPDYASPEQIMGEPVTIASDVYSLGVVLFELLTGERPYRLRRDTRGALEDAILQCEPRRPSELPVPQARALRGDLDTIVLKALHKKAGDRYATVNALADDLRRHLQGRPVLARPDSAWYRISRFVRRNRIAVATGSAVTVALIAATIVTGIGLVQARAAEKRALAEAETSRQVSGLLVDLFKVSDPREARGNTITAREILDKAAGRIDRELGASPTTRALMMETIADVYVGLGLYSAALPLAQNALEQRRLLSEGTTELADSLDRVGTVLRDLDRTKEAEVMSKEALSVRRAQPSADEAAIANTLIHLGEISYVENRFAEASEYFHEAKRMLDRAPNAKATQRALVTKYIANMLRNQDRTAESIPIFREALELHRAAYEEGHPALAGVLHDLAGALADSGQTTEALRFLLESLTLKRKTLGPRHPSIASDLNGLAVMYMQTNDFNAALPIAEEAVSMYNVTVGSEDRRAMFARQNFARIHEMLGHYEIAEAETRELLAIRRRTLEPGDIQLAASCQALAEILIKQKRYREAEPLAREAQRIVDNSVGSQHVRSAQMAGSLGTSLAGQQKFAEAETVLLRAYEVNRASRGDNARVTNGTRRRLRELYVMWNKPEKAAAFNEVAEDEAQKIIMKK